MKPFRRILAYIPFQWQGLVVIVLSVIITGQRFSTVITADMAVTDDGRIIVQGQHDELIQTCPLYESLYETPLVKT